MSGRTLRDAIAVALEVVPSVELAAGSERSHRVLHDFLLGWLKEYAFNRGVIFEDEDLEQEIVGVIAELRGQDPAPTVPCVVELAKGDEYKVACPECNAKPGWKCTSIITSRWREAVHAGRIAAALKLAQKGTL